MLELEAHRTSWNSGARDKASENQPELVSVSLSTCGFAEDCRGWRRRQWHPTPVLLPGKSRGWRSLVGCSPWGFEDSDTTERLHFHFSLSCLGEGNGNPLHCSCLENPRDGGAWWATVHGSQRVGHDWVTSLSLFTFIHWRRKWQPAPVFLPGESHGRGSLVGCIYGVAQSQTRLKQPSSSSSSSSNKTVLVKKLTK